MSCPISPIAAPEIDGVPVRFFKSPAPQAEMPWHAPDDLYRAMKFPRALRREMLQRARAFPDGDFVTVATPAGPVVIGSHPMAQGLIGAAIEVHGVRKDFEWAYVQAISTAWAALTGDLGPQARVEMLFAAARNTLNPGVKP